MNIGVIVLAQLISNKYYISDNLIIIFHTNHYNFRYNLLVTLNNDLSNI